MKLLLFLSLCGSAFAATTVTPTIKVNPATATVRTGATANFTDSATGLETGATVIWKVVSTAAVSTGDLGSVSTKGVYTAPALPPTPNTVLVEAIDSANAKLFASSTVTILSAVPAIYSLTPSQINTGLAYTTVIKGANFLSPATVMFDGKVVPSKFVSSTQIEVSGMSALAAGSKITVSIANPGPSALSGNATLTVVPPVAVVVTPDKQTIRLSQTRQFYSSVSNNADHVVAWQVNGKTGGDSVNGTIDDKGLYNPPDVLPAVPTAPAPAGTTTPLPSVTVTAISHADPTAKASVTLSLENALPVVTAVTPDPVILGKAITLTLTGTGFAPGAVISFAGQKLTTTFKSDTSLTATFTQTTMPVGRVASVKVTNPAPGAGTSPALAVQVRPATELMSYSDAIRFLEMASFGPTPDDVVHLQTIGRDNWIKEQLAQTASQWPDPNDPNEGVGRLQDAFFTNALTHKDQLRQRVAFALGHILVVSSEKDMHFTQMVSYQRILGDDAFGSFRKLLGDITLSPAMGYFLDMVNNDKANPVKKTVANENYAREVMQLFTVGLNQLNPSTGAPLAALEYDQSVVTEMAKVFTGWTYPPEPGFTSHWLNPEYYFAPMVPFEEHHDTTAKLINLPKPCTLPAGQTAANDLNQALDCLVSQTNVAPFISYRLIQELVTSSPSPAFVSHVAGVFNSTGGDLGKVVTDILTYNDGATQKLREPVLFSTTLLRALNATVTGDATGVRGQSNAMGQDVLDAPSVFSYFSPSFRVGIPGGAPAVAPEFQLLNSETAFGRINFAYRAVTNGVSGNIRVDLSNLQDLASDATKLSGYISQALYRGAMAADASGVVQTGITASNDALTRVRNGLYVAAGAPQYQVEQ